MPRQPRKLSETGVYHVMVRGINQDDLFLETEDYLRYLDTLAKLILVHSLSLLGYCLMKNHVHLLLKDELESISIFMHRLGASYAHYFNNKYMRTGHVFQNRFKSECVEDDVYLKTVIRYIHQNPVKAGLVENPEEYHWSSCNYYYGGQDVVPGLTNVSFILSIFSEDKEKAIVAFKSFNDLVNPDTCMEDDEGKRMSDGKALAAINRVLGNKSIESLWVIPKKDRNKILHQLRFEEGISIRQIARLTGVSFNIVKRA